jgi:hypothetical protein
MPNFASTKILIPAAKKLSAGRLARDDGDYAQCNDFTVFEAESA